MTITSKTTIGGPGTSPEDIAVAAGLPRGSSALHASTPGERLASDAGVALDDARDDARHASDDAVGAAQRLRDRAAHLAEQASDAVGHARDGVAAAAAGARDTVSRSAGDLRDKASQAYGETRDWAAEQGEAQRRRLEGLSDRGAERLRQGKSSVEAFVSENPLLVGVVGVAAGLLLGALLPRTRGEDRAVGPWADEVRDQGLRYARDITNRGREFVESALDPEVVNAAAQRAAGTADGPLGAERSRPH